MSVKSVWEKKGRHREREERGGWRFKVQRGGKRNRGQQKTKKRETWRSSCLVSESAARRCCGDRFVHQGRIEYIMALLTDEQ